MKKIILFCFFFGALQAQDRTIDSLKMELKNAKHDTTRCRILSLIIIFEPNDNIWPNYNRQLKFICEQKLKFITQDDKEYKFFINNYANSLRNTAFEYSLKGDIKKQLDYLIKSLKMYEKTNNKNKIHTLMCDIGLVYIDQGETKTALQYFTKSLTISENINNEKKIAHSLNNIAIVYNNQGDTKKALNYFIRGLKIFEKNDDQLSLVTSMNNIGFIYKNQGEIKTAFDYFTKSLAINEKIGDKEGIIISLNNIGDLYFKEKKYKIAIEYCNKSLLLAKERREPIYIRNASLLLYKIYKIIGKKEKALSSYEDYITMRDSISNEKNKKAVYKSQINYEYETKTLADSLKIAEEKKITSLQLKQEKKQRYSLYIGLALVALFGGFMYNRFRLTQKQKYIIELKEQEAVSQNIIISEQKHLVEEKHKEITESVDYAERIQKGFLVTHDFLNTYLKNGFVLFKPKDKVSGDFYWAEIMTNGNVAVCVADSTGHGVPGAFMSLLNMSLLNEGVLSKHFTNTADILNFVRKILILGIKPNEKGEGGNDGMDCVLFSINYNTLELEFTGANNSLWIVRKNNESIETDTEVLEVGAQNTFPELTLASRASTNDNFTPPQFNLIELKGDKMPVGRSLKSDISFTSQTFQLQKGDTIYASTDGFIDQFGGEKQKKFMSKQLKDVLLSICHLHEDEQKEKLHTIFESWKGNLEQVDDVTVMGIKI